MDREQSIDKLCYYSVLGIRKSASFAEIRNAYRKLALKWHPDRWTKSPSVASEANVRFQQIQEAYSVLSDQGKRATYDAGLFDPCEGEDEGFSEFVQEMLSMMKSVKSEDNSFEDLQKMFVEMVGQSGQNGGDVGCSMFDSEFLLPTSSPSTGKRSGSVVLENNQAKRSTSSRINASDFGNGLGIFMAFVL